MRKEDWAFHLNEAIEENRSQLFDYGSFDCALFCADCVDAMTGSEIALELERRYVDARSAIKFLRSGESFASLISEFTGAEQIPVKMAKRGDVVLFDDEGIRAYSAICVGALSVTATHPRGIAARPTIEAAVAWRID